MEKLGWFAFYPRDWKSDQQLGRASAGARGIWMEFLSTMFVTGTSNITGTIDQLARDTRCSNEEMIAFLIEAQRHLFCDVTDCNGTFSVSSRRFEREEITRAHTRERVRKFRHERSNQDEGNGGETPLKQKCTSDSVSVSVSNSLSDLDLWFRDVFVPAYPEHRQVQTKTAIARLKGLKPDVAERTRILDVLELWKQSAEWTRDEGKYVPGMGRFFADGWHNRQPRALAPGSPGPRLSPGRQSLFESIQRDREKEHGTVGSEVTPAQSQRHLDPPADGRRGAG